MAFSPPRKNKTETLIGPSNYLNIAQGNRLPVERATNVINTLIQNKILKDEKTENLRVNLKVQDETALAATRVQKLTDDLKNNPNAAFLTEQQLSNSFNKHAEKEFKLLRNMQKNDPNAAKFLFSNIHTVLNNGRKDFFKVKDNFLAVTANQAIQNSPTYIKDELAKYKGNSKIQMLDNIKSGHLINMQSFAINYKNDKFNLAEATQNATLEALEQLFIEDNKDEITGRINYDKIIKTLKDPKEKAISGLGFGNLMSEEKPGLKAKSYRNSLIERMTDLKDKQLKQEKIFFDSQNKKKLAEGEELLANALKDLDYIEKIKDLKEFFYQEGNLDGPNIYNQLEKTAGSILKEGRAELTDFGAITFINNKIKLAGTPDGVNSEYEKFVIPGIDDTDKFPEGHSILERLGMDGPGSVGFETYQNFKQKLEKSPIGQANIRFDDEVKNQVSYLIGANLGNLISQDVIDRVMSIKTAKLRKILNKKLKDGITEDQLFSPGNPNFIFDPRGSMLPFVATTEDNEKYQDESFGDGQLTDEAKRLLLKDQSYDGDELKKSDDYNDVESEDQKNLEKAIKILKDKPDSINFFIKYFGEENVPDDLKNLIPPQSKIPAGDIIEDVEQVASTEGGLFEKPEFVKLLEITPPGPNATEEEEAAYLTEIALNSVSAMGSISPKLGNLLSKIKNLKITKNNPGSEISPEFISGRNIGSPGFKGDLSFSETDLAQKRKLDSLTSKQIDDLEQMSEYKFDDSTSGVLKEKKKFNKMNQISKEADASAIIKKDAQSLANAYQVERKKLMNTGEEDYVETYLDDFIELVKNPNKIMTESELSSYFKYIDLEDKAVGDIVDVIQYNENKLGKLIVKVKVPYNRGGDLKNRTITITEPTLQKLIDKELGLEFRDKGLVSGDKIIANRVKRFTKKMDEFKKQQKIDQENRKK